MKVKIYDQYKEIFLDNTDNQLKQVTTAVGEAVDANRYSLVHTGVGNTVIADSNLNNEEAINLVTDLYYESRFLGERYDDKMLRLNEGYAELVIYFSDGRILNRVIFIEGNE